jgi:hypothetical protein
MIRVPFQVNDEPNRKNFLQNLVFSALEQLSINDRPLWGMMTSQQMVEHLLWALEISNGAVAVECNLPPKLIERFKGFLYNDTPTSHEFMNPLLKKGLPPLRFVSIQQAVEVVHRQIEVFIAYSEGSGKELRTHPVFGPLNHEEWERAHFKHYYHHLLQFELISDNLE